MVVDQIKDPVHDIPYWKNKGVELVDLSKITDYMIKNSNCIKLSNLTGKKLYTFLNYLNNEALAYTDDKLQFLNTALENLRTMFLVSSLLVIKQLWKHFVSRVYME